MSIHRRSFLLTVPVACLHPVLAAGQGVSDPAAVPVSFPSQDPALAREMVSVSHGNVARVRELVGRRPALANAAWDWGFGDWESALGAASHVGNREIATLLLAAGARPSIFSAAMLGQLEVVKAFVLASPGIQKTRGPHGITLLSHAKAGNASEVVKYLESVGDADTRYTDQPLADADRSALLGTYAFGAAAVDRLIVSANARGALAVKREGGVDRALLHQGGRVFHPIGADAVRLRFSAGERADAVTIEDGDLVVTAKRI